MSKIFYSRESYKIYKFLKTQYKDIDPYPIEDFAEYNLDCIANNIGSPIFNSNDDKNE